MKKQFLLPVALLLAIHLIAQESTPIVLVSMNGKVTLVSEGKTKGKSMERGAVIRSTSKIDLAADASAVIFCDGQFHDVKGPGPIAVSSICSGKPATRKLDVDYEFGDKLMGAVIMVNSARQQGAGWSKSLTNPKKNGDGWGNTVTEPKAGSGWGNTVTEPKAGSGWGNTVTEPKAGSGWGNTVTEPKAGSGWGNTVTEPKAGSGWGGLGSSIRLILPFGKVDAANTLFTWSRPATQEAYVFEIKDESGKSIHRTTLRDTALLLDLTSLKLMPEHPYFWTVSVGGSKPMVSNEMSFGIGDPAEKAEIMKRVSDSPLAGKTRDANLSRLIEAVALENGEWFYAAKQIYTELARKNSDPIVRMMHSAFWMRYGFKRLAETAAKG